MNNITDYIKYNLPEVAIGIVGTFMFVGAIGSLIFAVYWSVQP